MSFCCALEPTRINRLKDGLRVSRERMNDSNLSGLAAQIDFLVRRKFGHMVANMVGGTLPAERDERLKEAEEYQAKLCAMPPEDLQTLYEEKSEKERIEWQAEAEREEAHRFFNQPRAAADFEYWRKCAYWTLDEAIALSLGRAPQIVSWKELKEYTGIRSFASHRKVGVSTSPFAIEYKKRIEIALRASHFRQLDDPVPPWKFLAWAKRIGIEYPAELEKQVVARGHQIADSKSLHDEVQAQYTELEAKYNETQALLAAKETHINGLAGEIDALRSRNVELEQALQQGQTKEKPLSTRERETALKLIIGMPLVDTTTMPR